MLKSIKINNYKSCANVEINDIDSMVILVGRNGVGKSNILRAINWAARSATTMTPLDSLGPTSLERFNETSVELEFALAERMFRYTFGAVLQRSPSQGTADQAVFAFAIRELLTHKIGQTWIDLFRRQGQLLEITNRPPITLSPNTPCLPAIVALLPPSDPLVPTIADVLSFLHSVRYYPFDEPNETEPYSSFIWEDRYKQWLAQYNNPLSPVAADTVPMRILHMSKENNEQFNELKSLIGSQGLDLIDDIEIRYMPAPAAQGAQGQSSRSWYFLTFYPCRAAGGGTQNLDWSDLSLGTRRLITIIVSVLFGRSAVILGEHPEDGIHSGLTRKLLSLLRRYSSPGQLILSSHSLVIFNMLQPTEVRLVTMKGGKTTVRALTQQELEATAKFISEEGTLSDVIESIEG